MPQTHEIEQIIQQLRSEDPDAEAAYLGIFYDEQNSEYWYIKANRTGLHKYAADLLAASAANDFVDIAMPGAPLASSWLDKTGDAQPLFVQFVSGPDHIPEKAGNSGPDWPLRIGCWLAALTLGGILLAGIKEIIDLLRA